VFGYRIPSFNFSNKDYLINTYWNNEYIFSTANDGSETILDLDTLIYVTNISLPVQIGGAYSLNVVNTTGETIFLDTSTIGYDGYDGENILLGNFVTFILFGQVYLFDGAWIYLAEFTNNILNTTLNKLAAAEGLQYIATTPTAAFFLSTFDNSLYTYSGGRNLEKFKRFTTQEIINQGTFSVKDNVLALDTNNTILFIRDSLISRIYKTDTQKIGALRYYDTTSGLILGNNTANWRYSYYPTSSSSVVPLQLQTAYFGMNSNDRSILKSFVITIYNGERIQQNIEVTHTSFDQDAWYTQTETFVIKPTDYSATGYARIRLQPKYQRGLGNSIRLSATNSVVISDLVCIYDIEQNAVIASTKSK